MSRPSFCSASLLMLALFTTASSEAAEKAETDPVPRFEQMTPERLGELVQRLDPDAQAGANQWRFNIDERELLLIFDAEADRVRILTPIASADALPPGLMMRMLQANFDAVLDVRYAIANGIVWSTFLHPLGPLTEQQLASAVSQVFIAADTFGTTFISGSMQYGGGDSKGYHEDLERKLLEQISPSI